jgi:regulatory protein
MVSVGVTTVAFCLCLGQKMPIITLLEPQKNNPQRISVYLDGEYAFGVTDIEAHALKTGQVLSDSDIDGLKDRDSVNRAFEQAVQFLSFRPRSLHEIRTALTKKYDPETIDLAIERLETMGYASDVSFGRFWIENRNAFKPLSGRALRFELRQKGVSNDIINELLEEVSDDDAALDAIRSQVRKWRNKPKAYVKQQALNFLQRRGFAYGVANRTIQVWFSELEDSEPNYFAEDSSLS